jgi:hypothetical protein
MLSRRWLSRTAVLRCVAAPLPMADSDVPASDEPAKEAIAPPIVTVTGGHSGTTLEEAVKDLPFRFQMVELKRETRGVAQRPKNLAMARTILDRCIPQAKADLKDWLNEDNATTALNGASFFELPVRHQAEIEQWTLDNVSSFKTPFNIASAAVGLASLRPDDEEVKNAIVTKVVPLLRDKLADLRGDSFHTAVKLFQRLHLEDEALWSAVCDEIKRREAFLAQKESAAIRLFSCIARHAPTNPVTRELFEFLASRVQGFRSYDFTTFLSGAERWGQLTMQDALPLLRRQGERTHFNNARDLGVCFPACVRLSRTLAAAKLSPADALTLAQHLHFIFDACEAHLERSMDPSQPEEYWKKPGDVVSALYAYESSNHTPPRLFNIFAEYVMRHLSAMDHWTLSMSLGVLRRAGKLTPEIVKAALPAIESGTQSKSFTLEEASHVALSLVSVGSPKDYAKPLAAIEAYAAKNWPKAAKTDADVIYGSHPHAKAFAALNLAAVFKNAAFAPAELDKVTVRQLVDVRTHGVQTAGKAVADKELARRIHAKELSDSDLALVALTASKADDVLRRPAQVAVSEALESPQWGPHHLGAAQRVQQARQVGLRKQRGQPRPAAGRVAATAARGAAAIGSAVPRGHRTAEVGQRWRTAACALQLRLLAASGPPLGRYTFLVARLLVP